MGPPPWRDPSRITLSAVLMFMRQQQGVDVHKHFPFSWIRVVVFVGSYALLLSDLLRGGVVVSLPANYNTVEPDVYSYFGPFGYPVATVAFNDSVQEHMSNWIYKYDSTSIAMRAFVAHFNLTAWSPCLLYATECRGKELTRLDVFEMLDSLSNGIQMHGHPVSRSRFPRSVLVRSSHMWIDRLHELILPEFFLTPLRRTNQAIFFAVDDAVPRLCAPGRARAFFCDELWTNFRRHCLHHSNGSCHEGTPLQLDEHIEQRVATFQAEHQALRVDLLVLDSRDDYTPGSKAYHGRRRFDVTTILRARNCTVSHSNGSLGCATVFIDDYRYEGTYACSDVRDWQVLVAILRVTGQAYMWGRLAALFIGSYCARTAAAGQESTGWAAVRTALLIMVKIPSQVITYGSSLPILCYVIAHAIDSPMAYNVNSEQFTTLLGALHVHFVTFIQICAVQMRNVWMMALAMHAFIAAYTRRSWSLSDGVPGVSEFVLTTVSALTLSTQWRSTGFRNSAVRNVVPVLENRVMLQMRTLSEQRPPRLLRDLMPTSTVDFKMLGAALVLLVILARISHVVFRVCSRATDHSIVLWNTTSVPNTASTLWPANDLVVSWSSSLLKRRQRLAQVDDASAKAALRRESTKALQLGRNDEIHTLVFLVNLAMMTDPITLMKLRVRPGASISLYYARHTHEYLLLPSQLLHVPANAIIVGDDLELCMNVHSTQLSWSDLLRCG